jgi:uncharacterized protein YcaQ
MSTSLWRTLPDSVFELGPSRIEAASLLSPFDPVVWYRDSRLFGFDYRIQIFFP